MKNIELTKKGKIVLTILVFLIFLGITIPIIISNTQSKISGIYLDVDLLSEGDKIDYSQDTLILHVNSNAQLNYTTIPKNRNIDVMFNNYDDEIINIDSNGIITALKTGKTELQIFNDKNISSNIIKVYVY